MTDRLFLINGRVWFSRAEAEDYRDRYANGEAIEEFTPAAARDAALAAKQAEHDEYIATILKAIVEAAEHPWSDFCEASWEDIVGLLADRATDAETQQILEASKRVTADRKLIAAESRAAAAVTIPRGLIDEARALLTHSTGGERTFAFLERVAALAAAAAAAPEAKP